MLADVVGNRVAALRKERGLTREQVSLACSDLGWPLSVDALVNIETRTPRRGKTRAREITIDEIVLLARLFEVPPLVLIFPVGKAEQSEIGLSHVLSTWDAVKWFVGEATLEGGPIDDEPGAAPLMLYRRHEQLIKDLNDMAESQDRARREAMLWRLADVRSEMRRLRLIAPDLPDAQTSR